MALTSKVASVYEHVQAAASDTWVIVHNLARYPVIDIYVPHNGDTVRILPLGVAYTNANTCTVTFSTPRTGVAAVA